MLEQRVQMLLTSTKFCLASQIHLSVGAFHIKPLLQLHALLPDTLPFAPIKDIQLTQVVPLTKDWLLELLQLQVLLLLSQTNPALQEQAVYGNSIIIPEPTTFLQSKHCVPIRIIPLA